MQVHRFPKHTGLDLKKDYHFEIDYLCNKHALVHKKLGVDPIYKIGIT